VGRSQMSVQVLKGSRLHRKILICWRGRREVDVESIREEIALE
jgi:hypothetical protein